MAPQSKDLGSEVVAMRKIEAAFLYAETLPPKIHQRVLRWAQEVYLKAEADE